MTERYPDDATLLALEADAATGVEYIPTGRSPYYLEFRKLVQRLLLAAERANDLRVYQDGELTIGVRGGSCLIHALPIAFTGAAGIAVVNNSVTSVWLDATGEVQTGESDLPADRTSFIPLAEVTAEAGAITAIADLRGQAMLAVPDTQMLGLTVDAEQINQALDGIAATVDAAALNLLTAGPQSNADTEHHHSQVFTDLNGETEFRLINDNAGGSANIALKFDLSSKWPGVLALIPDPVNAWLKQRYNGLTYTLVCTTQAQFRHEGDLAATQSGKLVGVVPISGVISDVILSVGSNIQSSNSTDGVTATVNVNGNTVTTTAPAITHAAGAGFRSTAQGHGTAAVIKTDGTQNVNRGDVLKIDLTRSVSGTVSSEAADVVAVVVMRPNRPE